MNLSSTFSRRTHHRKLKKRQQISSIGGTSIFPVLFSPLQPLTWSILQSGVPEVSSHTRSRTHVNATNIACGPTTTTSGCPLVSPALVVLCNTCDVYSSYINITLSVTNFCSRMCELRDLDAPRTGMDSNLPGGHATQYQAPTSLQLHTARSSPHKYMYYDVPPPPTSNRV